MISAVLATVISTAPAGGIQWFSDLKQGLDEAKRINRPILLLSAAPQCAEVPGNW